MTSYDFYDHTFLLFSIVLFTKFLSFLPSSFLSFSFLHHQTHSQEQPIIIAFHSRCDCGALSASVQVWRRNGTTTYSQGGLSGPLGRNMLSNLFPSSSDNGVSITKRQPPDGPDVSTKRPCIRSAPSLRTTSKTLVSNTGILSGR